MTRSIFRTDDPDVNAYRLLTALIVPRPIAWVSTQSADGVGNLAPHSFFTVASTNPPIISFTTVGHKDTLANVVATGQFVVNMTSRTQLEQVNNSSANFAADVDEATELGITMEPSELVGPPRVADSPASLECTLHSTLEVGDSVVVFGEVVAMTVRTDIIKDGHPEMSGLQAISRLGNNEWGLPPEVFDIPRPVRPEDIT
ncbi:hypothetical protein BH09ACT10_BH09ACT10_26860 [soil metagenome]